MDQGRDSRMRSTRRRDCEPPLPEPLAYFLTWPTYGTWLPGDERGWVEYRHGWQLPDPARKREAQARLTEDACLLDQDQRRLVELTIAAIRQKWWAERGVHSMSTTRKALRRSSTTYARHKIMQINLNPTSERGASRDAVNRPRETLGDSHLISSDPRSRFGLVCDLLCCRGNTCTFPGCATNRCCWQPSRRALPA